MGIWEYEPNTLSFKHAGLKCEIRRNMDRHAGHLCGYVELPEGHPWWALSVRDDYLDVDVHGGVTWGPEPLGPPGTDPIGWVGFDCAHTGDRRPWSQFDDGEYRDLEYVTAECRGLADAIRAAEAAAKTEPAESVRERALRSLGPEAVRILEEAARKA